MHWERESEIYQCVVDISANIGWAMEVGLLVSSPAPSPSCTGKNYPQHWNGVRGGGVWPYSQVSSLWSFVEDIYCSISDPKKASLHQSTAVPAGWFWKFVRVEKGEFRSCLVINPCKNFIFYVPCPGGRAGSVFYSFYSLCDPNPATDEDGRL